MVKALIVIDMFVKDIRGRYDETSLVANQVRLIKKFREKGFPVIFAGAKFGAKKNPVYDRLWGDEYGDETKPSKEAQRIRRKNLSIVPKLIAQGCDTFVEKEAYSAFFGTDLERYCKKKKIDELYFAGVSAGCCVFFSALDAMYRRIQPILVSDASSSPSLKRHKMNIENFTTFVGPAMTTKDVLRALG